MLKDNFRPGLPLAAIRAAWLNAVARILNNLSIAYTDDTLPSIQKPPQPSTRTPWKILIPRATGGSDRWGRVVLRPFGTEDKPQDGVAVGDMCLWQYREIYQPETKSHTEKDPPEFVGKLQGGAGLPDGLVIPGSVYVETGTNHLVQGWLRWNATRGAFEEQMDAEGVPTKRHVAYINASFGPLGWEQGVDGWQLVQRLGYVSPNVVAGATWQQGDYNNTSSLPSISFAAAHNPELTE